MISRHEAEAVADVWARRDSARHGRPFRPSVVEFDLGYVVTSLPAERGGPPLAPGDGIPTVIDRETGELTHWPAVPDTVIQQDFRAHRARRGAVVRTADPAVELRRELTRSGLPTTVSRLELPTGVITARGAKGDQRLRHHRLVLDHLRAQPAAALTRGVHRHAELIALSDALHEADRLRGAAGQPPIGPEAARALLAGAPFHNVWVREPDDPAGGADRPPCETCLRALVHFGVLPRAALSFAVPFSWAEAGLTPPPVPPALAGRFPPAVTSELLQSGWSPGWAAEYQARQVIAQLEELGHRAFPAAQRALTAFPFVESPKRGPGYAVWIQRLTVNPGAVAHTVATLADAGRALGSRLFPLGTEAGGESILAVDEHGRVYALDQAGEWLLGAGVEEAVTSLLLGGGARRVRDTS
jgi:hypothetical protein